MTVSTVLAILAGVVVGIVAGYAVKAYLLKQNVAENEAVAGRMIEEAKKEASSILSEAKLEAKETLFAAQTQSERESKERLKEAASLEKSLLQRAENLDKRSAQQDKRENDLKGLEQSINDRKRNIESKRAEIEELHDQQVARLEEISGMDSETAKEALKESMVSEAKHESAKMIKQITDDAQAEADRKSKWILSTTIQRYAADVVSERTVSVVNLPSEEMKGRIIGREGRNIRSIEAVTGVDLIIDDTPDAVIVSCFDPVKREVARQSLERLVVDGRIHPSRIEDVVDKVQKDLAEEIFEAGQQATFDVGLHGINNELVKLIGRLKYRTSFSQNVYQHSLEVAHLCGILAAELGVNQKLAKRIGLLHDIGKAVTHEVEGSHAIIGADLAKRHGEKPDVVEAIAAHHNEAPMNSVYGFLVQAADSLSAARPGARREMLENYVKRLEDLEKIASDFEGVDKSFAVQAGREVRVMVNVDKMSDEDSSMLAKDIAKDIEAKLTYPGQIKVVVIRESRATEFAK